MNNLENLKLELLSQKQLIEKSGGYVVVAGTNPSPAEITEGIKTIAGSDLSIATATEDDVRLGKTFYAGGPELKTGTVSMNTEDIHHIFMPPSNTQTCDDVLYYVIPENLTEVKHYCFENNYNKVHITFHENIKRIAEYAFYYAKNFTFENFADLTQLTHVNSNAFNFCISAAIDLENLPKSITTMDEMCFANTVTANSNIKLPENLVSLGQGAFKMDNRVVANNFEIATKKVTGLNSSLVYNIAFNCDFVIPSHITSVSSYFNYGGCFRNIVIPQSITHLYNFCFGSSTTDPVSNFYLDSVVFESETPPYFGLTIFATQNITNGFNIYVPDNSVDVYKSASNFSRYANNIHPMSEKE